MRITASAPFPSLIRPASALTKAAGVSGPALQRAITFSDALKLRNVQLFIKLAQSFVPRQVRDNNNYCRYYRETVTLPPEVNMAELRQITDNPLVTKELAEFVIRYVKNDPKDQSLESGANGQAIEELTTGLIKVDPNTGALSADLAAWEKLGFPAEKALDFLKGQPRGKSRLDPATDSLDDYFNDHFHLDLAKTYSRYLQIISLVTGFARDRSVNMPLVHSLSGTTMISEPTARQALTFILERAEDNYDHNFEISGRRARDVATYLGLMSSGILDIEFGHGSNSAKTVFTKWERAGVTSNDLKELLLGRIEPTAFFEKIFAIKSRDNVKFWAEVETRLKEARLFQMPLDGTITAVKTIPANVGPLLLVTLTVPAVKELVGEDIHLEYSIGPGYRDLYALQKPLDVGDQVKIVIDKIEKSGNEGSIHAVFAEDHERAQKRLAEQQKPKVDPAPQNSFDKQGLQKLFQQAVAGLTGTDRAQALIITKRITDDPETFGPVIKKILAYNDMEFVENKLVAVIDRAKELESNKADYFKISDRLKGRKFAQNIIEIFLAD